LNFSRLQLGEIALSLALAIILPNIIEGFCLENVAFGC